jgi:hypothetical protein
MNNEPVAWIDEINTFVLNKDYKQFSKNLQNGMIPLYTHPAKTLTDEEIEKVFFEILGIEPAPSSVFDFARAILRKAQEK